MKSNKTFKLIALLLLISGSTALKAQTTSADKRLMLLLLRFLFYVFHQMPVAAVWAKPV